MKYRYLLIDSDATLLDFERSEREAITEVFDSFSIPVTEEILSIYSKANREQWELLEKRQITKSQLRVDRFINFCQRTGYDRSAVDLAETYESALASKSFLLPGALDVCTYLSSKYELYLVTNGFKQVQRGRFDPSPLAPLFRDVFVSEIVGADKPDKAYFDYVKAHIPGFRDDMALMIGDSLSSDMAGGIGAGLDVCWFNPHHKENPGLRLTYVISDLKELKNIL